LSTKAFERGYALLIGVDVHSMSQFNLPVVSKDITALMAVLTSETLCGYKEQNVQLLQGKDATLDNIKNKLQWLRKKVVSDDNATVFIYYSGHGVRTKDGKYFLFQHDIPKLSSLEKFGLNAKEFATDIGNIQAKRLLVVLDCCHAAGMEAKGVSDEFTDFNITKEAFPLDLLSPDDSKTIDHEDQNYDSRAWGEGRAILNSSKGNQKSYFRLDGSMSLFTSHFIEALTGRATKHENADSVLVTDIMSYVSREVKATAAEKGYNQEPVMSTTGVFPIASLPKDKELHRSKDVYEETINRTIHRYIKQINKLKVKGNVNAPINMKNEYSGD
jgi:hypothetical protein